MGNFAISVPLLYQSHSQSILNAKPHSKVVLTGVPFSSQSRSGISHPSAQQRHEDTGEQHGNAWCPESLLSLESWRRELHVHRYNILQSWVLVGVTYRVLHCGQLGQLQHSLQLSHPLQSDTPPDRSRPQEHASSTQGTRAYPEGHEGRLVADGRRLVAHHVRHRQAHVLARSRQQPRLAHHLIHPRPATLLCTTRKAPQVRGLSSPSSSAAPLHHVTHHTWRVLLLCCKLFCVHVQSDFILPGPTAPATTPDAEFCGVASSSAKTDTIRMTAQDCFVISCSSMHCALPTLPNVASHCFGLMTPLRVILYRHHMEPGGQS